MQGMCGVGKKVYFIKKNKGDSKATLYTAKIENKKIKTSSIKIIAENIKGLNHANSMTAVESGSTTHLFIAPGKAKGYILHLKVKKNKVTNKNGKAKRINSPSGMGSFKATGIASFVKSNTRYYVLRQGDSQKIVTIKLKDLSMKYVSSFKLPPMDRKIEEHERDLNSQGSTFEIGNGYYYLPYSYPGSLAKNKEIKNEYYKNLRKNSYIRIYKLDTRNIKSVKAYYSGTYKLEAKSSHKIEWKSKKIKKEKKKKKHCVTFEMEDLYIYDKNMYFNSEGGTDCHDFLGRMGI